MGLTLSTRKSPTLWPLTLTHGPDSPIIARSQHPFSGESCLRNNSKAIKLSAEKGLSPRPVKGISFRSAMSPFKGADKAHFTFTFSDTTV